MIPISQQFQVWLNIYIFKIAHSCITRLVSIFNSQAYLKRHLYINTISPTLFSALNLETSSNTRDTTIIIFLITNLDMTNYDLSNITFTRTYTNVNFISTNQNMSLKQ